MRLAASTCTFPGKRFGGGTPLVDSIRMLSESGFKVCDLNFCSQSSPNSNLLSDNWEKYVNDLGEAGAKYGIEFSQSHAPFDSNTYRLDYPQKDEDRQRFLKAVDRAVMASGMLGVKWVTTHAQTAVLEDELSFENNMKMNHVFYDPIVELAKKYNTGIAIENMAEFHPDKTKMRFTAIVEEQIALIDSFKDPAVGACWDFGHAELVYRDQSVPLRKIGHRLRATHVQENDGKNDDHYLPFVRGKTNWEVLMPLLKEIGYEGDFTYEVHGFFRGIPEEMRVRAGIFAREIGEYLISLYEKA